MSPLSVDDVVLDGCRLGKEKTSRFFVDGRQIIDRVGFSMSLVTDFHSIKNSRKKCCCLLQQINRDLGGRCAKVSVCERQTNRERPCLLNQVGKECGGCIRGFPKPKWMNLSQFK